MRAHSGVGDVQRHSRLSGGRTGDITDHEDLAKPLRKLIESSAQFGAVNDCLRRVGSERTVGHRQACRFFTLVRPIIKVVPAVSRHPEHPGGRAVLGGYRFPILIGDEQSLLERVFPLRSLRPYNMI